MDGCASKADIKILKNWDFFLKKPWSVTNILNHCIFFILHPNLKQFAPSWGTDFSRFNAILRKEYQLKFKIDLKFWKKLTH